MWNGWHHHLGKKRNLGEIGIGSSGSAIECRLALKSLLLRKKFIIIIKIEQMQ